MSRTTRRRRSRSPTASPSWMPARIVQLDTPETLYQRPASVFVARFVGFENLIPLRGSGGGKARSHCGGLGGFTVVAPDGRVRPYPRHGSSWARALRAGRRPIPAAGRHPGHAGLADLSRPSVPVSMPHRRPDRSSRTGRSAGPSNRANARLQPVAAQCCVLPDDGRAKKASRANQEFPRDNCPRPGTRPHRCGSRRQPCSGCSS